MASFALGFVAGAVAAVAVPLVFNGAVALLAKVKALLAKPKA